MKIDLPYILALFVGAILLIGLTQRLLVCIKRDDESLFIRLGSPDLFRNNNLQSVYKFWSWIAGGKLDKRLSVESRRLAWILRVAVLIYLIAFGFSMLSILFNSSANNN